MLIGNGIGKSIVKNEVTVALKRKFVGLIRTRELMIELNRVAIYN